MVEVHHVQRIQREARRGQAERYPLSPDPCLHQGPPTPRLGKLRRHRHGEGFRGDPRRLHGDAPRLHLNRVVILVRARDRPFQGLGKLGLLPARKLERFAVARRDQIVNAERDERRTTAHEKADNALAFDGIETEVPAQHGERGPRALYVADHIAVDRSGQVADIDLRLLQPSAETDGPHERPEADPSRPCSNARAASFHHPPKAGKLGEEGVGARVPGPDSALRHMHHPAP